MEGFQPNTEKGESPATRNWNTYRENYDSSGEWQVEQEMVRSVIESFNEEELRTIFIELAGKSGVDVQTLKIPSFSDLKIFFYKDSAFPQAKRWESMLHRYRMMVNVCQSIKFYG